MRRLCKQCGGSGKMMGGGMMAVECNGTDCENGFVYPKEKVKKQVKLDKRSSSYKKAHRELMQLGLSEKKASEELEKGLGTN